MRSKTLITGLLALALTSFGQAAMAADSGFYFSGKVGSTTLDGSGFDDSDLSFHPSFGYDFNEYWGIELGYDNFGDYSDSCGAGCTISVKDADGYNFRLVGTYPINDKWSLYGSTGLQHWDVKVTVVDTLGTVTLSDDGDEVVFGIGAKVRLGDTFSLRGGFDFFEVNDLDAYTFYIGGEKKFY